MAHINIDGEQNVEVSKPIPSEKSPEEQLEIMEEYTRVHKESAGLDKAIREINCLKVIFPRLFRSLEPGDLIAGRLDFLPIGFGSVTSIGGVGHYCVFHKLRAFKSLLHTEEQKKRVDALYDYWQDHDVKSIYCQDVLTPDTTGRFIDCQYPFMATARLSGMMLDYQKLMRLGIDGLLEELRIHHQNAFIQASQEALLLFKEVIQKQIELVKKAKQNADLAWLQDLDLMEADLIWIKDHKPATFHQALQLFWLYALCAGCINYGRMDMVLGPYLKKDMDSGQLNEEQALRYIASLWKMIENRRTTVNGRIIVGGRGRQDVEACDLFCRLCLKVCKETRYVEPQFTLRFDHMTPDDILDMAYECIASGATYPTLYNDDVNVPAVQYAMRVPEEIAEQYVPFGCGEFVIQGKSVGTPNTLLNMLKLLQIALNEGIDPMDGIYKAGPVACKPLTQLKTFEDLMKQYEAVQDYYFDLSIDAQKYSYKIMNQEVSFLFSSILMDDCIARGKALLDGGVEILGGTNETYGNINASDALYAIKKLVYDKKKYTLEELNQAALANFKGYEALQKELLNQDKYGNDKKECDELANRCYEYVAKGIRQRGIDAGLGYYLIVISNNQTNTDWGHQTDASLDGRNRGVYMNPANNPQGGAAKSGPTAVLNSLVHFDAKYHGGSVQNMKFTPRMMHEDKEKVKALFRTYFENGGCQLMVTVVDHGQLEDAQKHPEKYPDLIVRVAGYSAVFVNLSKDIQDELLSRTLYD
ncbi:pyruvate formate lyase family protein [Faecalicoccus acidiformans]|uniref:pyruvate formate lyase family protein n=1 Tax=Faecalicoccus acidiformans TaxID=915173 RepID=UPI00235787F9|nr:pyruvate formate lyase family protein [Faecalicoccus acidiformans]